MIGNGLMDWTDGSLEKSSFEYMMDHDFVDPDLDIYYQRSCLNDPLSAGCRYFEYQYQQNTKEVNPYSIYGYCYYNDTDNATKNQNLLLNEAIILNNIAKGRNPSYT